MIKANTIKENRIDGLNRLIRLYAHYEKHLNCNFYREYFTTLHTLDRIERKIVRYRQKIKEGI